MVWEKRTRSETGVSHLGAANRREIGARRATCGSIFWYRFNSAPKEFPYSLSKIKQTFAFQATTKDPAKRNIREVLFSSPTLTRLVLA